MRSHSEVRVDGKFWRELCTHPGGSNLQPAGHLRPRMAVNVTQHKIISVLKTFFCPSVAVSVCVFNVWPRDAKRFIS